MSAYYCCAFYTARGFKNRIYPRKLEIAEFSLGIVHGTYFQSRLTLSFFCKKIRKNLLFLIIFANLFLQKQKITIQTNIYSIYKTKLIFVTVYFLDMQHFLRQFCEQDRTLKIFCITFLYSLLKIYQNRGRK